MIAPPDADWIPALEHWCAGSITVVSRRPLTGGYASAGVLRIDLEDVAGQSVAVVLKRANEVEIAAMRALAAVSGVERPRMIASGRDEVGVWLLIPLYPGTALRGDDDVPANVWATLARDARIAAALALLPKTLVHGDAHRGNVLRCPDGGKILDWGNAKLAPPGLDLAVLRAQGAGDSACYEAGFADGHADADRV